MNKEEIKYKAAIEMGYNKIEDISWVLYNELINRCIELAYKEAKKSKWIEFDFHNKSTHPTQYGDYWVYRADCNKSHKEVWNGSGWAYNNKTITHWQPLPEKP